MVELPDGEKHFEHMCNRLDRIRSDRQTDRYIALHDIVRAMHTRRAIIKLETICGMQLTG